MTLNQLDSVCADVDAEDKRIAACSMPILLVAVQQNGYGEVATQPGYEFLARNIDGEREKGR